MVYYQDGQILIRDLCYADAQIITDGEIEQGWQATVDKYQALIGHLDEIQRKNDYRYTKEQWTEAERVAWKQAVDVINDKVALPRQAPKRKGLFGKK